LEHQGGGVFREFTLVEQLRHQIIRRLIKRKECKVKHLSLLEERKGGYGLEVERTLFKGEWEVEVRVCGFKGSSKSE